ncbi:hypothetical protein PVA44_06860 (plasmid) [Entomospira nematocerorum]|uniref:Uncharacterized protein n=1 Tax=Entomospira nematocerorum TaxID=2719987 RepID=A0A968KTQ5_9SPIO|nr:hypothetical protein [Entomospira nematocera]NIZ47626.1 hypothetical protein [Entomospira nematocera]WDI34630.1 hypothetical protein PVA44_06860 [Entomospira nematocera]
MHHHVVQFILASLECRWQNSPSYQWLTPALIEELIHIDIQQEPAITQPAIYHLRAIQQSIAPREAPSNKNKDKWHRHMLKFISPTPWAVHQTFHLHLAESGTQALQWWHRILLHSGFLPAKMRYQRYYARWDREHTWVEITLYNPINDHRTIHSIYFPYDNHEEELSVEAMQDRIICLPLFEHQALLQAQAVPAIYQHMIMTLQQHVFHRQLGFDHFAHMLTMSDIFPHHYIGFAPSLLQSRIQSYCLGGARFPMQNATMRAILTIWDYPTPVAIYRVEWPITTVRLRSRDPDALASMATRVSGYWQSFGLRRDPSGSEYTTLSLVYQDHGDWYIDLLLWQDNRMSPLTLWQQEYYRTAEMASRDYIHFYAMLGTVLIPSDSEGLFLSSRDTETMTTQFYRCLERLTLIPDERSWYQWECYVRKKISTASS